MKADHSLMYQKNAEDAAKMCHPTIDIAYKSRRLPLRTCLYANPFVIFVYV